MTLTEQQKKEILDQQNQKNTTKRVTSPELEKILYEAIPVLDHGFVRVVDYMGDDSSIVQAARVSYGKGTKKVSTDSGLIKYLMRHRHTEYEPVASHHPPNHPTFDYFCVCVGRDPGSWAQGPRDPGPFLGSRVPSPGSQGVSIRMALVSTERAYKERINTERANGSAGRRGA